MNAKQRATWEELVRQCESRQSYSSINVASKVRSDAIVAAGALVKLVTPELAALLEGLARVMDETGIASGVPSVTDEIERAYALAACIKEILDDDKTT